MYQAIWETASVFHVPTDVEQQSKCQAVLVTVSVWGRQQRSALFVCVLLSDDRQEPVVT